MSKFCIALAAILSSLAQTLANEEIYSIKDLYPPMERNNCQFRDLQHGRSVPHTSSYPTNTFVSYLCEDGYELSGSSSSRCLNGAWISEMPSCNALPTETMTCQPRTVKNGAIVPSKKWYNLGDSVGYKCLDGYVRSGSSVSTCLKGGEWSTEVPVCEERPKPTGKYDFCSYRNLEFGSSFPEKTAYKDRSVVIYSCKDGYNLLGEGAAACFGGMWTAELPVCEEIKKRCPYRQLLNGIVSPKNDYYDELSVVVYACNDGHKLRGQGAAACFDGMWTTDLPHCEGSKIFEKTELYCFAPSFSHGSYLPLPASSDKKYAPGSSLTFRCKGIYNLKGSRTANCLSSGEWDQIPVCETGCRKPRISNGFYETEAELSGVYFEPGHEISFYCNPSYRLRGVSFSTCLKNGRWQGSLPVCEKWIVTVKEVGCPPPIFPYGTYSPMLSPERTEYSVGDRVVFTCSKTYHTNGPNYATCLESREWSPVPTCSDECAPPKISNGAISPRSSSYKYKSRITLDCNKGYLVVGNSFATCLPSGVWSAHLKCSDGCYVPKISRMTISPEPASGGRVYEFGNRVSFKCDAGFSSGTIREAECRGGNRWDKALPKCHALTSATGCPMPALADGLLLKTKHQQAFPYKAQLEFACEKGYRMVGSAVSICRKHLRGLYGGFDPSPPVCHRLKCGSPGKPQNGRFRDGQQEAYYFGDTVYFECEDKHIMSGSDHITCNANGQFSSRPPKCQPPSCRVECKYIAKRICQCDRNCRLRKDCCHDFEQHCRKLFY